jgi:hypothetical protein
VSTPEPAAVRRAHAAQAIAALDPAGLRAQVLELAAAAGWLAHDAGDGWLLLARGGALALVTIRGEGDKLDPAEVALLAEVRRVPGVVAECWRPSDLGRVRAYLEKPRFGTGRSPW